MVPAEGKRRADCAPDGGKRTGEPRRLAAGCLAPRRPTHQQRVRTALRTPGTRPEVGCGKSPVRPSAVSSREASPIARKSVRGYENQWRFRCRDSNGRGLWGGELASPMDPIRGFCGKLRSLAVTLDTETARLQRALDGEDSGKWAAGRTVKGVRCHPGGRGRASSPQSVLIKTYRFIAASPHCSWHVEWLWSHPNRTSLVAQMIKRLSKMWETRVRSLGREDPLEKEMATHSSTIAWKIPWMEEPGRL